MQKQLTLPGQIVKKENRLIRTKINVLNIDGSRILANLIACIKYDDTSFKETYKVSVKDFITDPSGRAYKRIKDICRQLLAATAEIEEVINGKKTFQGRTFFTQISYSNGYIYANFNEKMNDVLINLKKCFTQYNLIDYLRLPSIYSQRIFEILKSWEKIDKGYVDIELFELHRYLNTPASSQKNFGEFRRYILEKAHKDILEKTDLKFEWKALKNGRKVESVRFIFSDKKIAIEEKSKEEKKKERQSKLNNQRFARAYACAIKKNHYCENQDNVKIICKICLNLNICKEFQKLKQYS